MSLYPHTVFYSSIYQEIDEGLLGTKAEHVCMGLCIVRDLSFSEVAC